MSATTNIRSLHHLTTTFSLLHHHHHHLPVSFSSSTTTRRTISRSYVCRNGLVYAAISRRGQGASDRELRSVLELATDSELYELKRILFSSSYFSPLLKSISSGTNVDYVAIEEDLEEREYFIGLLESRFLFLAADARSTLRGWRPSYRNVLLDVRKELKISCSSKLSTEDLEVEIFLHLLRDYSSDESGTCTSSSEKSKSSNTHDGLQLGLSQWKLEAATASKVGAMGLKSIVLKGGGMFTMGKIYQLLARTVSGKMFLEAANYQIKNEVIRKVNVSIPALYFRMKLIR